MQNHFLSITFSIVLITAIYLLITKFGTFQSINVIPCQQPLTYQIGTVDPKFDISARKLRKLMQEVEGLWQTARNQEVLNYSEDGRVTINLIFSEEQQQTKKERRLSRHIKNNKQRLTTLENEYQRLSQNYKRKKRELEHRISKYHQTVKNYNDTIKKWSSTGGIPQNKKPAIKDMKRQIERLAGDLRRKETNAETIRRRVNTKADRLNTLLDQQSSLIAKYNNEFGEPRKFDQGEYIREDTKERINIYQFSNQPSLKTVLAHEAGHALGIAHVDNPKSIMNATMDKQDIFDLALTEEDINALNKQCND